MKIDIGREILSSLIIHTKYARYNKKNKRRETWDEIIDRYKAMIVKKYPKLKEEIGQNCTYLYSKRVLPSARAMQFGGKAIEKNPVRGYNCAFSAIDHPDVFKEIMFLLLSGTGVGVSVQQHHVEQLPEIHKPKKRRRHLIGDSAEGWAEAIGVLVEAYMGNRKSLPVFDYCDIRPKGTPLKTSGGLAPGPRDLKVCMVYLQNILDEKQDGEQLTSVEALDVLCHIADCVVSGGIRRSSMLALFSFDDEEMKAYKTNDWGKKNPQRGMVNTSAAILRHKIKEGEFFDYFEYMKHSVGDPSIFWTNEVNNYGTNPCLPSWSKVMTPNGMIPIDQIKVGDVVWSSEGYTDVVSKFDNGEKEVFEYQTTAGVFCSTDTHKIVSDGKKTPIREAQGIDVLTACSFIDTGLGYTPFLPDEQLVMDGLVLGDGFKHKASNNLKLLCIGTDDQDYFDSEIKDLIIKHRPGIGEGGYEIKTNIKEEELVRTYNRSIPHRYCVGLPYEVCSFLRGLYSANGSVVSKRVTLKASSKKIIHQVQEMLSSVGIKSYYTTNKPTEIQWHNGIYTSKESYDLNISSGRELFYHKIGFLQNYKNEKLKQSLKGKLLKGKTTFDIVSSKSLGIMSVYDLEVSNDSHTYWSQGFNVSNCGEAGLKSGQFCNLTSINTIDITTQEEFNIRAKVAAFFGTLQAGFTDFHLLREQWKDKTEEDALIGVSLAGIASGEVMSLNMKEAANEILEENERVSNLIGINKASRTTLQKPDGTISCVLGCSSGVHPFHSEFYIRRSKVLKTEALYHYLKEHHPSLLEDDVTKPTIQAIISIPIKAPEGAITRKETALQLLSRVKKLYREWVIPGHRKGQNTHSISCTVTIKPGEWDRVGQWLWDNRNFYASISTFPYDDKTYVQTPFEEITEEEYKEKIKGLRTVDFSQIKEDVDTTTLISEVACSAGQCEIS